jgi:hypothetical protein
MQSLEISGLRRLCSRIFFTLDIGAEFETFSRSHKYRRYSHLNICKRSDQCPSLDSGSLVQLSLRLFTWIVCSPFHSCIVAVQNAKNPISSNLNVSIKSSECHCYTRRCLSIRREGLDWTSMCSLLRNKYLMMLYRSSLLTSIHSKETARSITNYAEHRCLVERLCKSVKYKHVESKALNSRPS